MRCTCEWKDQPHTFLRVALVGTLWVRLLFPWSFRLDSEDRPARPAVHMPMTRPAGTALLGSHRIWGLRGKGGSKSQLL